ncbi:MAG: hypothetical protein ACI89X_003565 [Planctomycetota bacterium]|jgi:hypothetical protein
MNRRRGFAVISILLTLVATGGYLLWPIWDGARTAQADLLRGQPRYLLYGELAPYEDEATQRLAVQHGLAVCRVAGCAVTGRVVERAESYNSVVCGELGLSLRVFDDIVNELIDEHR